MMTRYRWWIMNLSWIGLSLAVIVPVAAASPPAGDTGRPILRTHPRGPATPVMVSLGLYVADISSIDEAAETFELQCYLYARWLDQRLATTHSADQNATNSLDEDSIWSPSLELANLISYGFIRKTLSVNQRGIVYWVNHFDARLSDEFALRRFPFDTQTLRVVVQPFLNPENNEMAVTFAPEDLGSGVSSDVYVGLASWQLGDVEYRTEVVSQPGLRGVVPQASFEIVVKRRSGFYWLKVFLPVLIMVTVSWSIFWVNTKEFDWQMKIPIATMLAMVAFEFAIARDLPRVSYITFMDAILLTSFVFIFLAMVESVTVHVMVRDQRYDLAERVHRVSRWAFPLAYAGTILILIPLFFTTGNQLHLSGGH